ncbi:MAG: iron chelate uptake ABC transporter family permease subunit [Bowdeniella nasicola]|nr:iron chelate uptake ABC transporter family permease subunit [Bowdeniella nasicola]
MTAPTTLLERTRPTEDGPERVQRSLRERYASVRRRILIPVLLAVAVCVLFMTYDALDAWSVIWPIRIVRLLGLLVVAVALSAATVVFQVVTRNRILSPSVMGFDAMFALIVTGSVFFLTSEVVNRIPNTVMFFVQASIMTVFAVSLFLLMLTRHRASVHLLVLVGIVMGILLRSLTTMLLMIMDPNEFLTVQDRSIASFAIIDTEALLITGTVTVLGVAFIMWRARTWDLLSLGQDVATALGVDYRREVKYALAVSSILVACATALVGPLMFFGLLVVNITVFVVGSSKVQHLIPGAAAVGVVVLVGGQAILEHIFDRATVLSVALELFGGALLLFMIIKEARR